MESRTGRVHQLLSWAKTVQEAEARKRLCNLQAEGDEYAVDQDDRSCWVAEAHADRRLSQPDRKAATQAATQDRLESQKSVRRSDTKSQFVKHSLNHTDVWQEEVTQQRSCKRVGGQVRMVGGRRTKTNPTRFRVAAETTTVVGTIQWLLSLLVGAMAMACIGAWIMQHVPFAEDLTLPSEEVMHETDRYTNWWVYPCLMAQSVHTGVETVMKGVPVGVLSRMNSKLLLGYGCKAMLLPTMIASILSSGYLPQLLGTHSQGVEDDFAAYGTVCSMVVVAFRTGWLMAASRWYRHWTLITALDDRQARYRAMTVEWLCPDGVVREFLFDT